MDVWDWVDDFERQARARGDDRRLRLVSLHPEAYEHRETNPDRALALFEEGRRLACALREPWWVLFYDHWRATALMHFKRDLRHVLDLVVQTTLEVRKPLYERHPLRLAVFDDLVAAYLCIDPRGYAPAIAEALRYLEEEVPAEGEPRYMLLARQRAFAFELGMLDEALALARRALALADTDPDARLALHHNVFTYATLCKVAQRKGDWDALGENARAGEEHARRRGHKLELAQFLVWRALWARHERAEEEARRRVRQATAQVARLGMPPTEAYHDALAAFYELAGDLPAALEVRRRQLADLAGKGHLAVEADCRIKTCRLLASMGLPTQEEAEGARGAVARLRAPEWYWGELQKALAP
jgi:hypothetical protein